MSVTSDNGTITDVTSSPWNETPGLDLFNSQK